MFLLQIKYIQNRLCQGKENIFYLQLYFVTFTYIAPHTVGNKVKGRISKRLFQVNKATQLFQKTNISYPLIRPRTVPYDNP